MQGANNHVDHVPKCDGTNPQISPLAISREPQIGRLIGDFMPSSKPAMHWFAEGVRLGLGGRALGKANIDTV